MTDMSSDKDWDKVITSQTKYFDLKLNELWHNLDLIMLFVKRDFISVYKQTILGPVWHLIKPLLSTFIFTIVFGRIANIPTDGLPQFIFFMSGNIAWIFSSDIIFATSGTFIDNKGVFGKVYFPRMAVPISVFFSKMIAFIIQILLFTLFIIYFKNNGSDINPNFLYILLTPLIILHLGLISIGIGVYVSAITTRFRDLQVLTSFGVSLLMYATPIVYPLSTVPDNLKLYICLNPYTHAIEFFKIAYLGVGFFDIYFFVYSVIISIIIFLFAVSKFNKIEQTFMDTI